MTLEDYERERRAEYERFGSVVASILEAVIFGAGSFRLQQVKSRAKTTGSLAKKLTDRGQERGLDLLSSDAVEQEIKDLAGCRVIFYTNSDVSRLIASGLIEENFEVLETKLHHPRQDAEEASQLYISNHYLVRLRPERTGLAEYSRFSDMRCEIQIQTILNHAWAEMAHDTIYKEPNLDGFGSRALDLIKDRMARIARRYLVPAGYEFAKVAADFDRLMRGEDLFRGEALAAVAKAANNNERAEAIETFAENVLPLYDNLAAEFPDILATLSEAVEAARKDPGVPIETPYGEIAARTALSITRQVAKLIGDYRNIDPTAALDVLVQLYEGAASQEEREVLAKAAKRISGLNLAIWRRAGPHHQAIVLEKAEAALAAGKGAALLPLLVEAIEPMLGSELEGSESRGSALVLQRAPMPGDEDTRLMRRRATSILKTLYPMAESDEERSRLLAALRTGARPPVGAGLMQGQAAMLLESAAEYVEFLSALVPDISWDLLQSEEKSVLRLYQINNAISPDLLAQPEVLDLQARLGNAITAFRAAVESNGEYGIFRLLVGFGGVFPPSWDNPSFDYQEEKEYRTQGVSDLVAGVTAENEGVWYERAMGFAGTRSNDLMTFPIFGDFLARLGEQRPAIALAWLEKLAEPLASFASAVLRGLQKVDPAGAERWLKSSIDAGRWLAEIAWFERNASPFDEAILAGALKRAIESDERHAIRTAMHAAGQRFPEAPGNLIAGIFMPALHHMSGKDDSSWVGAGWGAWHFPELMHALDADQAAQVLAALQYYPDLDDSADQIVGAIGRTWPEAALDFFGERFRIAHGDERPDEFDPIPYTLDDSLREAFAAHPALLLQKAREWYDRDARNFRYFGGSLITSTFPAIGEGLEPLLAALAAGSGADHAFLLSVLAAYDDVAIVAPTIRVLVAGLEAEDPLLDRAARILGDINGVVMGEMGIVERLDRTRTLLRDWLTDPNARVQTFAAREIETLDRRIAAETRAAEISRAARKLEFGDDLDDSDT